jgi:predicted MPP superfamily phosphohydrolase
MPHSFRSGRKGLVALAAVACLYSWQVEPRRLRITRLRLAVPDLPPAFEGYRIAHLSDLHLGVTMNQRRLPDLVCAANRENADLLAITGDFATGHRDHLEKMEGTLADLRARDGVWACLGNHDYHYGAAQVEAMVCGAGIGLLRNAHTVIVRGADRLVVAGIDDVLWGVPNLGAALNGIPDGSPIILLAHEPDFARIAAADPRITLQLSGHTHGGQVRLPGIGALILPMFGHVYPFGAYRAGTLALYVTAGTGTAQLVMRFNCRPEIALITLARGAPEQDRVWRTRRIV